MWSPPIVCSMKRARGGRQDRLPVAPSVLTQEAVNRALETTLEEGLRFERRLFQSLFATQDQKEGMTAFISVNPPSEPLSPKLVLGEKATFPENAR